MFRVVGRRKGLQVGRNRSVKVYSGGSNGMMVLSSGIGTGLVVMSFDRDEMYAMERNNWFEMLKDEMKDPRKLAVAKIIGANAMVLAMWKVSKSNVKFYSLMEKHFTCSAEGLLKGRYHTLLTSYFSHESAVHFGFNMFMLYHFAPEIIAIDGGAFSRWTNRFFEPKSVTLNQFYGLYFGAGLASSAASAVGHAMKDFHHIRSLGASGAVLGVFTMFCLLNPDAQLLFFGLVPITGTETLILLTGINAVGSVVRNTTGIDYIGHLGGQCVGFGMNQLN